MVLNASSHKALQPFSDEKITFILRQDAFSTIILYFKSIIYICL